MRMVTANFRPPQSNGKQFNYHMVTKIAAPKKTSLSATCGHPELDNFAQELVDLTTPYPRFRLLTLRTAPPILGASEGASDNSKTGNSDYVISRVGQQVTPTTGNSDPFSRRK